jgi:hypothetical protein
VCFQPKFDQCLDGQGYFRFRSDFRNRIFFGANVFFFVFMSDLTLSSN